MGWEAEYLIYLNACNVHIHSVMCWCPYVGYSPVSSDF